MQVPSDFAVGQNTASLTEADYKACADRYDLETALVHCVTAVEAGTTGFWSSGNMKLLYEGHIAFRETAGDMRKKLVKAGLAWEHWGDVPYGKSSVSRDRLRKAIMIAGDQAYRWASYGLGQVMGFNAEKIGYKSAKAMFLAFLKGEAGQLDGMLRFIKYSKLLEPLRNHSWSTFARGYNGSGYAKHNYQTRLENAYKQFSGRKATVQDTLLTIGDKGAEVEKVQNRLVSFGAEIEVDGAFGRATAQAVSDFQKKHKLKADGIVGPKTMLALFPPEPAPKPQPQPAPKVTATAAVGGLIVALGGIFHESIIGVFHALF